MFKLSTSSLRKLVVACCSVIAAACLPVHTNASTVLQNGTVVHLNKTASDQVTIDMRLSESAPVKHIIARIGDQPISMSDATPYPAYGQVSAILFLVDTSDPSRQHAVDRATGHIEQILARSNDHLRFGLARFDTNLHLLSPIGTDRSRLLEQAKTLKAVGKTTELYRNTLGAIRILNKYPADRRFLFLLSDGLAEDRAYFHSDVVQSALQNDVSIYTIGYSDTVSRTVALQTLRRLSEDTGGQYLSTAPGSYKLDESSLQELLSTLDSGMQFRVNFKSVLQSGTGGNQQLDLSVELPTGGYTIGIPISLPKSTSQQPQPLTPSERPVQQVIVRHVPTVAPATDYYWILFIALSLLMMGLIIFLALRLRSGAESAGKAGSHKAMDEDAYAWLERINGSEDERYPVQSGHVKIGRFRGNDVILHDPAVSRYHAEIRFNDDGRFMIADLGSKNGIMVNDQEVFESVLHDQDIIEIGDIRLRFTIQSDFAADMEDTQMFRTQFPPSHPTNH